MELPGSPSFESSRLRALLKQQLDSLAAAGVEQLPRPTRLAAKGNARRFDSRRSASDQVDVPTLREPSGQASPLSSDAPAKLHAIVNDVRSPVQDDGVRNLDLLREQVATCSLCAELAVSRTRTVFGVGNPSARLCFLGEAPGADEDRIGEPFVGRAGELLNKILGACRIERKDVYILNVLKCRPPGNRTPAPEEASNCRPFLDRQLALIRPEFICCLGAVAAQNLLGVTTPIGKLRGVEHAHGEARVYCTYHPAYLLRNPSAKKYAWDDMKMLMRAMGTPID